MTLNDLRDIDREYLIPREIAPILGCDPQDIRVAAKQAPERLGFNVAVIGTRVRIPRKAFIYWMEGKEDMA